MKKRDPDVIEDNLDEIDARIKPNQIPPEDRPALARAREILKRLRSKTRK